MKMIRHDSVDSGNIVAVGLSFVEVVDKMIPPGGSMYLFSSKEALSAGVQPLFQM